MAPQQVVVTFNLSETNLRAEFSQFLSEYLTKDLAQSFHGEVTEDELAEIKRKAGSIEYDDDYSSDKIVVYEHETLGFEKTAF